MIKSSSTNERLRISASTLATGDYFLLQFQDELWQFTEEVNTFHKLVNRALGRSDPVEVGGIWALYVCIRH